MEVSESVADYKQKYKTLKRKLKGLVFEHELLSEQLEKTQKKLLRVSKDRSFLLDRMLQYEKVAETSSDSDATDLSDSDTEKPATKKQKTPNPSSVQGTPTSNQTNNQTSNEDGQQDSNKKTPKTKSSKKHKSALRKTPPISVEEIEKHLDLRPQAPVIEKATSAVPADIFHAGSDAAASDNEADTGLVIDMK